MTLDDHRIEKAAWLRAAVLGANDGVVSTASLVLGVAAASASTETVATAGLAGLFAGAFSMAAGEYVSVSSERDLELAELAREERHLRDNPDGELRELTSNLAGRGLDDELAKTAAAAMTKHDALAAHAHGEFGLVGSPSARPGQSSLRPHRR